MKMTGFLKCKSVLGESGVQIVGKPRNDKYRVEKIAQMQFTVQLKELFFSLRGRKFSRFDGDLSQTFGED